MRRLAAPLSLVALFLLYFFCLPSTVQTNDTGETVANAYLLHLIHPPGYPLYMWLYHAFIKLVPVSTPFFRAGLLTSLLACGVVGVLLYLPAARTILGTVLIASFATARIVWEYAVLPDVFMLHLLIVAAMVCVYFSAWSPRKRLYVLAGLMALGVANHHTIVFMAPLVLAVAWEHRKLGDFILAGVSSVALATALYLSLMTVSHPHLLDWRDLQSVGDLWRHFLRDDYGTFQLSIMAREVDYKVLYTMFAATLNLSIPLVLLGTLAGVFMAAREVWRSRRFSMAAQSARYLIVAGALLLYLVIFLPLCNLPATGFFVPVIERFFLMPALLFTVLGIYGIAMLWPHLRTFLQYAILAAGVFSVAGNLSQRHRVDFSRDTLIEDYVIDLLNRAGARPGTVLVVQTDTVLFGARYVQYVLGVHPEIPVLILGALPRPHMVPALQAQLPGLVFSEKWREQRDLESLFVENNFGRVGIFSMLPLAVPHQALRRYKVGYEVVGSPPAGPVDDPQPVTRRTKLEDLPGFVNRFSLALYGLRCSYDLDRADHAYHDTAFSEARDILISTIGEYPYCFSAIQRLCQLYTEHRELGDASACDEDLRRAQAKFPSEYGRF